MTMQPQQPSMDWLSLLGQGGQALLDALNWMPRQVLGGAGSLAGLLPTGLLQGASTAKGLPWMSQGLARMGLAAQSPGEGNAWDKTLATGQISPLDSFLASTLADPITYIFPGADPLKALSKGIPQGTAFAKGLGYTIKANEAIETGLKNVIRAPIKGFQVPGLPPVPGLQAGVGKLFPKALEQAPESLSLQMGLDLEDFYSKLSPGAQKSAAISMNTLGSTQPLYKNGRMDTPGMSKVIKDEKDTLAREVSREKDDILKLYKMYGLSVARTQEARTRSELGVFLSQRGDLADPAAEIERTAAWGRWFASHKMINQALRIAFKEYGGGAKGASALDPEAALKVREIVDTTLHGVDQFVNENGKLVSDLESQTTKLGIFDPNVHAAINELYHERDANILAIFEQGLGELQGTLGDIPLAASLGPEASTGFFKALGGLGFEEKTGMTGAGFIDTELKKKVLPASSIWSRNTLKVGNDQQSIFTWLKDALGMQQLPDWGSATAALAQRAGQVIPPEGLSQKDLLAMLKKAGPTQVNAEPTRKIINLLGQYKNQDILLGDARKLSIPKTQSQYLDVLKGHPADWQPSMMEKLGQGYQHLNQAFRENILVSLSFPFTNFTSGLSIMLQHSPPQVAQAAKNAMELFPRFSHGVLNPKEIIDLVPSDARNMMNLLGEDVPPSGVAGGWVTGTYGLNAEIKTVTERAHPLKRAAVGAGLMLPDAATGAVQGLTQMALGGGYGLGAGILVRGSRSLSNILESGMRFGVYVPERMKLLQAEAPKWLEEVNVASRKVFAPEPGAIPLERGAPWATGAIEHPIGANLPLGVPERQAASLQDLLQELAASGGITNQKELPGKLARAGFNREDVVQLTQSYVDMLGRTSRDALKIANDIHVNYTKFNNLENLLDQAIPFTRWPIRMYPHALDMIAENPALISFVGHYKNATLDDAERLGLKGTRYENLLRVPGGLAGAISDSIFGAFASEAPGQPRGKGDVYIDPTRIFFPLAQAVTRVGRGMGSEPGLVGKARQALEVLGSPFPALRYPLQIASAQLGQAVPQIQGALPYGVNEPFPTWARFTTPPLGQGERGLQELIAKLTGVDPYNYERADVQRRLGELGAEDTGYVKHPQYEGAKGTESGPLYQKAVKQVRDVSSFTGFMNYMLPLGVAYIRPSEAEARAAHDKLPKGPYDTPEKLQAYKKALGDFPWAQAHTGVSGEKLRTALNYSLAYAQDPSILFPDADPKVALELTKSLDQYDAAPGNLKRELTMLNPLMSAALQRKALYIQNNPLLLTYYYWRSQIHPSDRLEGEEGLQDQFFKWYNTGGRSPKGWTS